MKNRKLRHVRAALKIVLVGVICIGGVFAVREIYVDDPGKLLVEYMDHIEKQEYSQMYAMLDHEKSSISTECILRQSVATGAFASGHLAEGVKILVSMESKSF